MKYKRIFQIAKKIGYPDETALFCAKRMLYPFSFAQNEEQIVYINSKFNIPVSQFCREIIHYIQIDRELITENYHFFTNLKFSFSNYDGLVSKMAIFPYWQNRGIDLEFENEITMQLDGIILPAGDLLWDAIWPPICRGNKSSITPLLRSQVKGIDTERNKEKVEQIISLRAYNDIYPY
jgi:hypothetical protein